MPHCFFLPSDDSAGAPPLFLLHRSTHFTVLKPQDLESSWAYYRHLISNTPDRALLRHIPTLVQDITMPTIASAIGVACRCSDPDSLGVSFSLLLRSLQERHSLDRPSPSPAHLQHIDLHEDADGASLDLLAIQETKAPSPTSGRQRDAPSSPDRESPRKSAGVSSPSQAHGLGRTARDPTGAARRTLFSQALSLIQPNPPLPTSESLSTKTSQMSLTSEVDMGSYVDKECGRNDNAFASRIRVYGGASSDETSESGSLLPSSRSASLSQAPSMFSTGSLHEHLVPRDAEVPGCTKCRRHMGFFRFIEENHSCDSESCGKTIARNAYGWHCADCDVDLCAGCWPYTWSPVDSFASSIPESAASCEFESLTPHVSDSGPIGRNDGAAALARSP